MFKKITLREWQQVIKPESELFIQSSTDKADDSWVPFPIGMQYNYMKLNEPTDLLQLGSHDKLLHCGFWSGTDQNRRGGSAINRRSIENTLRGALINNVSVSPQQYFLNLPNYKFVISPEGNGIDCHRHYEALLAGCIPIIEDNPLIREKYAGCPILYTTDYSEISSDYLEGIYAEMIDREYDFSRLFLDFYDENTQAWAKRCGNYWCERLNCRLPYSI